MTDLVPEYISSLPLDPVSGNYGYSSTGLEFMLLAKGSTGPITYTDSNGFDESLIGTVGPPYISPRFYVGGAYYEGASIDDNIGGSFFGNVVTSSNSGWNALLLVVPSEGFSIGKYDIYLRLRANDVTSIQAGVYNETTTTYIIPQKWIVGLTSYYQVKYFSTITITESNLNDRKRFYFAGGGQWFVDYVEFRKVN